MWLRRNSISDWTLPIVRYYDYKIHGVPKGRGACAPTLDPGYKLVPCWATNNLFVHVSVIACQIQSLDPSCGYMAIIWFGSCWGMAQPKV